MAKEKATSILLGLPSGGDQNKNNGFKNKWIYLSAVLFLALAAATYRLYFYEECPQIDFELSTIQNSEGAMFKFYDFTPGADTWEWDFGDNARVSRERSPIHLYKQAGTYDVMLTINDKCTKFQTITIIQEAPGNRETEFPGSPLITAADSSNVSPLDTSAATGFDSNPPAQDAARLVPVPDPSITINQPVPTRTPSRRENVTRQQSSAATENDISRQTSSIQETANEGGAVAQRPANDESASDNQLEGPTGTESIDNNQPQTDIGNTPDEPEPYQRPAEALDAGEILTDLDIKTMVFDVSELRVLPSDVMNSFCKGSMDRTIVDANNTTMSMGDFFERIEGKPIRIKSFIVHRDPQDNNCIVGMKIKYGKVGLF
ncbi:MAG: PKD domain-containing protein [Cyclobacteriaceae bacterium]